MACTVVFITFVLLETSWEVSSYSAANKIDNNIFEDDMIMTEEQYKNNEINRRTGLIEEKFKWSKIEGKVIVPYKFDKPKLWSKAQRILLRFSMNEVEKPTCIRFVERSDQEDYVQIFAEEMGCFAHVGRQGGAQILNLDTKSGACMYKGGIIHEFLHALGFQHMQSSFDRDKFIRINEDNIVNPEINIPTNFNIAPESENSYYGTSYDFDSIMHYGAFAGAKGFGQKAMETINPANQPKIDKLFKMDLSSGDIQRINNMYNCQS